MGSLLTCLNQILFGFDFVCFGGFLSHGDTPKIPQSSQSDHDLVETTMVQWLGIPHDLRTPTVALVAGWCLARFEVTSENDLFFHFTHSVDENNFREMQALELRG